MTVALLKLSNGVRLLCRRCCDKVFKFSRKQQILRSLLLRKMENVELQEQLEPFRQAVKEQGDIVRKLKETEADQVIIQQALQELFIRKKKLNAKEDEMAGKNLALPIDRFKLEDLLKRRFYYDVSFSIYGGITGLYDYGPVGCATKSNVLQLWRSHFILEEGMLEVDCSILTPEPVLKASGHVERFCDYMVKDLKTGDCFRADHLIKCHLEKELVSGKISESLKKEYADILIKLDGFSKEDMQAVFSKYDLRSPVTGNDLSKLVPFNLMFPTSIGPTGVTPGFLRPETAQGIFVNFKRLLQFNQGKLPFAAAQIGNSFRNEISPRQGLIRVREFTMAEIEHFVDPLDKNHKKFHSVKNCTMSFFSACSQVDGASPQSMTIGSAVSGGLVNNETLGYYMARVHMFLLKVGINETKLRFRQHLSNEMAHYATDCWDAECLTSHGWIECVGVADRSCYDLTQHSKATGIKLVAERRLDQPKTITITNCVVNKKNVGLEFKGDAPRIQKYLADLSPDECEKLDKSFESCGRATIVIDGQKYQIANTMCHIEKSLKTIQVEDFVPSVIEPSFGIGRILYAVFEHNFSVRKDDEQRTFLSLPPLIAPYKCSILPLSNNVEFEPFVQRLTQMLTQSDVSCKVDDSGGSIGKRYARTDEIAIPFGVTVDFDTLQSPHSITLRERDSMQQVRIPMDELPRVVKALSLDKMTWTEVERKYPKFVQQESGKK